MISFERRDDSDDADEGSRVEAGVDGEGALARAGIYTIGNAR